MAYGDFGEVKEVASGDEGESGKNKKKGININDPKQFTQKIATKWLENHNNPNNNITLNSIELKKAKEVAQYGS